MRLILDGLAVGMAVVVVMACIHYLDRWLDR